MRRELFADLGLLVGAVLVGYGLYEVVPALAWMWAGVNLMVMSYGAGRADAAAR